MAEKIDPLSRTLREDVLNHYVDGELLFIDGTQDHFTLDKKRVYIHNGYVVQAIPESLNTHKIWGPNGGFVVTQYNSEKTPTPTEMMDRYKEVDYVKCLKTNAGVKLELYYMEPMDGTDEIWARYENGTFLALMWKGGRFAEALGQKKSRDLLSEAREYFPLNARVRDICTGQEFLVLDKDDFYLVDDHTVGYKLGNQAGTWPLGVYHAHVYECSQFAHFHNVFPEGEYIGKEIDMLKKVKEAREYKASDFSYQENLPPNNMHPNDLIRFDLPKAAKLMAGQEDDAINPSHYKQYPYEAIEMMEKIWGAEKTAWYCEMTAFKYRMRLGHKDGVEQEMGKEKWYLDKAIELKSKL